MTWDITILYMAGAFISEAINFKYVSQTSSGRNPFILFGIILWPIFLVVYLFVIIKHSIEKIEKEKEYWW